MVLQRRSHKAVAEAVGVASSSTLSCDQACACNGLQAALGHYGIPWQILQRLKLTDVVTEPRFPSSTARTPPSRGA